MRRERGERERRRKRKREGKNATINNNFQPRHAKKKTETEEENFVQISTFLLLVHCMKFVRVEKRFGFASLDDVDGT